MRLVTTLLLPCALTASTLVAEEIPEIRIVSSVDEMIEIYQEADYWGELEPDKIIEVPPLLVVATIREWREEATTISVQDKKELFYRSLLPLVLYANEAIASDRSRLERVSGTVAELGGAENADSEWLRELAIKYRLFKTEADSIPDLHAGDKLADLLDELLLRVDVVPASLALGQGAYESGYGTSRFALEGNSYFGQWTYGGKGMAPKKKRASKGNYGVAAYAWPLDSVRSYMMNLNTHRAYAELRKKRAILRSRGEPISGEALAATLTHYSERGDAYVKTLTGMMRVNELYAADDARLLQQNLVLIVNAVDKTDARAVAEEISGLRASGELAELIGSMGIVGLGKLESE